MVGGVKGLHLSLSHGGANPVVHGQDLCMYHESSSLLLL